MEVEEAISCLSRFEQTSERGRDRGGGSCSTQVQSYQVQKERERDDWLSRVKVIDNIECVWPWLVT